MKRIFVRTNALISDLIDPINPNFVRITTNIASKTFSTTSSSSFRKSPNKAILSDQNQLFDQEEITKRQRKLNHSNVHKDDVRRRSIRTITLFDLDEERKRNKMMRGEDDYDDVIFVQKRYKKKDNQKNKRKGNKSSSRNDDSDDDDNSGNDDSNEEEEEEDIIEEFMMSRCEQETKRSIDNLKVELGHLRTSRASSGVVENIMCEIHGSQTPLKSLGAITVRDQKTIALTLYDNSEQNKNAIENAIVNEKNLKFACKKDETGLIITVPEMDTKARKELSKIAQELAEKSKIAVRRARKNALDAVKKQKQCGDDDKKRFEKAIQKVHDDAVSTVDSIEKLKIAEIMAGK
jgi:ribosome recycling factor